MIIYKVTQSLLTRINYNYKHFLNNKTKSIKHLFLLMCDEYIKLNQCNVISFLNVCESEAGLWAHAGMGTNKVPLILYEKPQGTKCSLKSSSIQIARGSRAKKKKKCPNV